MKEASISNGRRNVVTPKREGTEEENERGQGCGENTAGWLRGKRER